MVAQFKDHRVASRWIGVAVLIAAAGCALTSPRRDQPPATAPAMTMTPAPMPTTMEAATQSTNDPDDPDRPSPATAATLADLDRLTELQLNGVALNDVFDLLRKKSGLNIYVDWPALQRAGVTKNTPVTTRLRDIMLSKALYLIFRSVEGEDDNQMLAYAVEDGVVTISTQRELNKNIVTRVYDVNDLMFVAPDFTNEPTVTVRTSAAETRAARISDIKKYIIDNVDPKNWKDNGGEVGTISSSSLRAVLLITQTPENHLKIRAALDGLRSSQGLQVSIETRFIIFDDVDEGRLPAPIRQRLAAVHGVGRYRTDQILSKGETMGLIRSLQKLKSSIGITAPRLTLLTVKPPDWMWRPSRHISRG